MKRFTFRLRSALVLTLCASLFTVLSVAQEAATPGAAGDAAGAAAGDVAGNGLAMTDDALLLEEALAAAGSRTDVVNARLSQGDAELALGRTQADPLALRLEKTQAQQRLTLSEAQLRQARYQAIADIAAGYTQLFEAQIQLELARTARDVNAQLVDITRIRLENGSATQLDVQDALNTLQDAEKNLNSAEQGLALAQANLASLIGQDVSSAAPVSDTLLATLPDFEAVLTSLERTPALLQVNQGRELAEVSLDILDPSYASSAQLDNAKLQLEQAAESAKEARRSLEIQARSLYNAARTAAQSYRVALDTLQSAQEREALERQRLDAGLIADITFKQTQLSTSQAQIAAVQAQHAYLNALLNLQAGTLTALEGLHEF